ncbi:MAG: hypothetical protein ACJAQT_002414 [Akkermansiaceae bacterium]|jgi:hypothetical protein
MAEKEAPTVIPSFNGKYPLHDLSPRRFEELIYSLVSHSNRAGIEQQLPTMTRAELMQGVGERGRDLSLYNDAKVVGLIQCKHSMRSGHRLNKTEIQQEILKFLLHAYKDSSLIPSPDQFTYILTTNIDLSEPAKLFLLDTHSEISQPTEKVIEILKKTVASTKSLKTLKVDEKLYSWLSEITKKIRFNRLIGSDINAQIAQNESAIIPSFFSVKKVIDSELAGKITQLLEDRLGSSLAPSSQPIRDALAGYLTRSIITYRHIKTLVFRNQQMLLNDLYQPLTLISHHSGATTRVTGYPKNLLEEHRNILVRSTAGMGKSTMMRLMFINAVESKQCSRVPILIELRRLSTANDLVSEVLNRCDPLVGTSRAEFLTMLDQGAFVFFLDGYDEIRPSAREAVTTDLTSFIERAHKNIFVLTSRPDTALASFPSFQEFTISGLKLKESYELLNKYGRTDGHTQELVSRLKKPAFKAIRSFLENPMLVSLLFIAYRHTPRLPYKKHLFYLQVYQAVFEEHDLSKDGLERQKHSGLDISDFEKILRHAAFNGSRLGSLEYSYIDLVSLLERSSNFNGIKCSAPDFIKDLTSTVPLFIRDGSYYSWGHKSLQDYFSARFIETVGGTLRNQLLRKIYDSDSVQRFAHILEVYREMNPRSFRETILRWFLEDFESHCSSKHYEEHCSGVNRSDIKRRLELTFGRSVSFRVYGLERSEALRGMPNDSRIFDILSDWNHGKPFVLQENNRVTHNRQQDRALAAIESWKPSIYSLLRFLVNVEPQLVYREKNLHISRAVNWEEDRLFQATEPTEELNQESETFISINEMLMHGLHLNPKNAYQELIEIRRLGLDDIDEELLEF